MAVADNVNGPGLLDGRGANGFFERVAAAASWAEVDFGFTSMYQHVLNESGSAAELSWDADSSDVTRPVQAELASGEGLKFDRRTASKLFVRGSGNIRIMAW